MISFARPTISKQDLKHVLEAMLSDRLENGDLSRKLAKELGEFVGSQNLLVFNSKEMGLFLILQQLGLSPGDEVVIPAYGDPFILEVLTFLKLTPRFVDLKEGTYGMDLEKAGAAIGEKTKVLIVSHLFGYPVDIPASLVEREGLVVIEDATHALGCRHGEKHPGLQGNFGLFSLDSESLITTAQGGFVTCRHRKDFEALRDKRSMKNPERMEGRLGVSLSDLQSALGLSELSLAPKFLARRSEIGKYYRE
ncbi:MAG: DegT/DnrJ/EryC1/StrS aminotransferase family protein, partial [Spirochaetia bacterium]|nr:DegT/DnrJ/EryC1/StrS aminotransferase family protein [Spirochaetia bacterium]